MLSSSIVCSTSLHNHISHSCLETFIYTYLGLLLLKHIQTFRLREHQTEGINIRSFLQLEFHHQWDLEKITAFTRTQFYPKATTSIRPRDMTINFAFSSSQIWLAEPNVLKMVLKSPRFVPLWANLTQFGCKI